MYDSYSPETKLYISLILLRANWKRWYNNTFYSVHYWVTAEIVIYILQPNMFLLIILKCLIIIKAHFASNIIRVHHCRWYYILAHQFTEHIILMCRQNHFMQYSRVWYRTILMTIRAINDNHIKTSLTFLTVLYSKFNVRKCQLSLAQSVSIIKYLYWSSMKI